MLAATYRARRCSSRRNKLADDPVVEALGCLVLVRGPEHIVHLDSAWQVSGRGRQHLGALGGDRFVGVGMRRPIGEVLRENRLTCRIDGELDELAAHVGLWRALKDRPAFGRPQMLGPNNCHRSAIVYSGLGARVPTRTYVDLAALQQL